ncbi:hypothetical protein Pmani_009159 [Petrolisthes manimaculis]|uniref:Uncharacterized protein n=1 Tax=Petrolisthes manimaculis TaxID=1843537 RepID=A0AAE1Q703_9EUCA|nr:hypothetical protein Pmani_009159 [Petrolisthes manimaculis]
MVTTDALFWPWFLRRRPKQAPWRQFQHHHQQPQYRHSLLHRTLRPPPVSYPYRRRHPSPSTTTTIGGTSKKAPFTLPPPPPKSSYPFRRRHPPSSSSSFHSSSGTSKATLTLARAATQLAVTDDAEFYQHLCLTTDVCPYSWQWLEANLLRSFVRWSLLR